MSSSESEHEPARKKLKTTRGAAKSAPAPAKKRAPAAKKKKDAQEDASTFAPRVKGAWKIGAHVSAAGGIENSVVNAAKIGASAFALFLKNQRKWVSPAYTDASVAAFKAALATHGYAPGDVLPHGSYLLNLGNPDAAKRAQSFTCLVDDLRRAAQLGLELYNLHPGSTVGGCTRAESIAFIAQGINKAHQDEKTGKVVVLLENMAGQGNVVGNTFEDLRDIIALVDDKTRVGVCIDTCHMFAAGYDIRTKEAYDRTMAEFDSIVGASYLRGMHLNDSMGELGCSKDRHANLGLGHLGVRAFAHVVADARTRGIPLVLETPADDDTEVWAVEIAGLAELAGHATVEDASAAAGFERKFEEVPDDVIDALAAKIKAAAARSNKPKEKKSKAGAAKKKPVAAKRKRGKKDEDEDEDDGDEDDD